jgi:AraC-like DNA-binding protein/quercetin dioxygenase-like cupin family protein
MSILQIGEVSMSRRIFPSDSIIIGTNRMRYQTPLGLHRHDFHELVLVVHGRGIHFTEHESYPIHTGDVFLIKPGSAHGYRDTEELEIVNLFFVPEKLPWPLEDLREMPGYHALFELEPALRREHGFKSRLRLGLDDLQHAETMLERLDQELKAQKPGYRFLTLSWFVQFVFHVSACYGKTDSRQSHLLFRIGGLLRHIERHYPEPMTLRDMAAKAGVSERSLNRCFQTALGHSPVEYLIRRRVAKAAELLCNSDLSIGETGERAGFPDSNYFSRQFRRITGIPPREYRKNRRD